jgi:hypothetical protein
MKMEDLIEKVKSTGREALKLEALYHEYRDWSKVLSKGIIIGDSPEIRLAIRKRKDEAYEILEGYTEILVKRGVITEEERCSALDDMRMGAWA